MIIPSQGDPPITDEFTTKGFADYLVPRSLISIATYTLCGIIVKTPERRQLCHLPEREAI